MIFKHILGVIQFKASGDNHIRFLNDIRKGDFIIKKISVSNNEITGFIYGNDYSKLEVIAKKNLMILEEVKRQGLVYKIKKYKLRFGIIAGIIVSIGVVFYLSNIVLKVRITGCDKELQDRVSNYVSLYGITPGNYIPKLDFDEIERNLVYNVEDVSWASVRNDGPTIVVNVHQSTREPHMVKTRLPCNIISTRDAQIVGVEVYDGLLMVIKGDGVKKGEMLVSGITLDDNQKPMYSHSQAKIIGEYNEVIDIFQPYNDIKRTLSEKSIKRNSLTFFGLDIPISFGKNVKGEYVQKSRTNYISFLSLKLPIGICHNDYSPYEEENIKLTKDEAASVIKGKISIYEKNFLNGCEILDKRLEENENDEGLHIKAIYKVRGNIGKEQEILIK